MGIHDWTRVSAGVFHDFQNGWIVHLSETLNQGGLHEDWYSMIEPRDGSPPLPNVLPLRTTDLEIYHSVQKSLVIRHASDHRVVALLEIVSPSNKDREQHVDEFAEKARSSVKQGLHFVLLDLLPPGRFDPQGMHGRVWDEIGGEPYEAPLGKPLTLASYNADEFPVAYVEPTAMGTPLIPMPLFLDPRWYVNLPLQETYETAYRGVPKVWRRVIENET